MEVTQQNNTQLVSLPTDLTVRASVGRSVGVGVFVMFSAAVCHFID